MSMGVLMDRTGGGGFGTTGRGGMGGNLAMDKGRGQAEMVLGNTEGAECNMDWKASLVSCT